MHKDFIHEELKTPVIEECDVLVVGGGSAGIVAALAAVRNGASTVIVENESFLGGTIVQGGINWLSFFNTFGPYGIERKKQLVKGIPQELVDMMRSADPVSGHYDMIAGFEHFSSATIIDREKFLNQILQVMDSSGVKFYLKTFMAGVIADGGRVKGVIVESKSGRGAILAKVTVDATGDADVAGRAGAIFRSMCVPYSVALMFGMGNVKLGETLEFARQKNILNRLGLGDKGSESDNIVRLGFNLKKLDEYKEWMEGNLCWGPQIVSTHEDEATYINSVNLDVEDVLDTGLMSKAQVLLRKKVFDLAEFLRRIPGFQKAYVNWTAPNLGVRHGRYVECEHEISVSDVVNAVIPDDTIGLFGAQDDYLKGAVRDGGWYGIPYRAIVPKSVENLLVAGRMITSVRTAHMSTRLVVSCMVQGQAAGTAAALCARNGTSPRMLDVKMLQDTLRRDGVYLGD